NPKASTQRVSKKVNNDPVLRVQNLSILIRRIKAYYQETLQQLVTMPLPNVLVLGRTPLTEQGLGEVKKLLLLLLGCAVQCEQKEEYIERIQTLDFDMKAAIASHIQEVTHNQENVLDLQWLEGGESPPEDLDTLSRNLALHLRRVVDERDDQTIVELTQERDYSQGLPALPCGPAPGDSPSMRRTESRQHLSVELADAKAKVRRLRQELTTAITMTSTNTITSTTTITMTSTNTITMTSTNTITSTTTITIIFTNTITSTTTITTTSTNTITSTTAITMTSTNTITSTTTITMTSTNTITSTTTITMTSTNTITSTTTITMTSTNTITSTTAITNLQLLSDARCARAYRDELDALREKAIRVDKLESEVGRYKERLHDIDFYRARVEWLTGALRLAVQELKEDNQILLETKSMLEEQLDGSRARSDKLHELEKENLQLKAKIHDMEMERDMDRKRIEELVEENLTLAVAQKQSMDESLHLGWELEQLSKTTPEFPEAPQKSLGHEVNELTSSRLLKLEMENQTLLKTVEELKAAGEASSRLLKAEKENQRLHEKLKQLENEMRTEREGLRGAECLSADLMKEKSQLQKTLETLRENSERQVKWLEQENELLNQTVASLRQRSQVSAEARVKDVEQENRVLHESIKETSGKLNKLEFERKQLRKDLEYYKERGEKAEELEVEVHRLERENEGLQKRVASLGITCEKVEALEKENADLETESRRLRKKVDGLRNTSLQLAALEKENAQLEEENLELRRAAESLRSAGARAVQLELENRELEGEKSQLQRSLELLKASSKKSERLEANCQGLDLENQRLQKALENSSRKVQKLEGELRDLESENQSLQRNLEELKISSKRLEKLEMDNKALEQESSQLEKDKKQLEKENKRLRQQAEIRDSKLDDDNQHISHLEKENRALTKEVSTLKDSCSRIKDLERDNKELAKQATMDKKTLVTLREELVSEKLKSQQMNNDLEKLTHELEKIGLNKEGLLHDEQSSDARFKLLESKLESTLKSSLEIKEEKIAALEARLQESSNLNQQLRQELKIVKKNYEALRQREEEERMVQSSPPRGGEDSQSISKWEKESHEATRELLKVKDRLIEVERNNATLQAEKQALRTQLKQLDGQSANLQAQILALQRQAASLQENNTTLQTQNAKLQVENSALVAQNAQLQSQQSGMEGERDGAVREREELRTTHELLLRDHEKLAALHERQAAEYEALIGRHGGLKSVHKTLETQHRDLEDRYNQLLKQKAQLEELEKVLKAEQEKMMSEARSHQATATEYRKLKDDNNKLNMTYQQLLKDNEGLQSDHKNLKSQLNAAKLEQTRLEAEFSKLKEQYQQLDITSTKLTNQCELLSQLKGNLEEENRHLLDQIQTLMLQNRTLLEQTMESKDLFHVEQRQYMCEPYPRYCTCDPDPVTARVTPTPLLHVDKLNELRRQKEKLEEKIMDQYKFYDPSPPRRRGNWITLKMRKLIRPKGRERMRSLTVAPIRSESSDGFSAGMLAPPDSHDSSSMGSGSLDDTLSQKRSSRRRSQHSNVQGSSNALKRLPFMRNRSKEKDKEKAIYRRSMSMNDLLQTMAPAGGQWSSSTDHLDTPEEAALASAVIAAGGGQRRKELGTMAYSTTAIDCATLGLPPGHGSKHKLKNRDNVSYEDVTPVFSDEQSGVRAQGEKRTAFTTPPLQTVNTTQLYSCSRWKSHPSVSRE
ncbi:hypothetical protein P4O66_012717, partial [Electrophorus voltai]